MATHVMNKVNSRLRFLYRQNKFLDIPLHKLLCNAITEPFFNWHVTLDILILTKT